MALRRTRDLHLYPLPDCSCQPQSEALVQRGCLQQKQDAVFIFQFWWHLGYRHAQYELQTSIRTTKRTYAQRLESSHRIQVNDPPTRLTLIALWSKTSSSPNLNSIYTRFNQHNRASPLKAPCNPRWTALHCRWRTGPQSSEADEPLQGCGTWPCGTMSLKTCRAAGGGVHRLLQHPPLSGNCPSYLQVLCDRASPQEKQQYATRHTHTSCREVSEKAGLNQHQRHGSWHSGPLAVCWLLQRSSWQHGGIGTSLHPPTHLWGFCSWIIVPPSTQSGRWSWQLRGLAFAYQQPSITVFWISSQTDRGWWGWIRRSLQTSQSAGEPRRASSSALNFSHPAHMTVPPPTKTTSSLSMQMTQPSSAS